MSPKHLSTQRLLALYHEDFGDIGGLEHLASCPECRRAFDDSRWARLLARLPAMIAEERHPSAEEIEAYHTHALPQHRIAKLERHLRSCDHCLARAGRMRATWRRDDYRSPSPQALRSTMRRFRPRPLRRLGTLVVQMLEKGGRLMFVPEALEPRHFAAGLSAVMDEQPAKHPSSVSRRASRLRREKMELRTRSSASRLFGSGPDRTLDWTAESSTWLDQADSADRIKLTLAGSPGQRASHLKLEIVPRSPDRTPAGIRVRIRHATPGRPIDGVTDEKGTATLPLPPDSTELIVETEPALSIRLRHEA